MYNRVSLYITSPTSQSPTHPDIFYFPIEYSRYPIQTPNCLASTIEDIDINCLQIDKILKSLPDKSNTSLDNIDKKLLKKMSR